MPHIISAISLLLLITSCATQPQLTRAEWLQMTHRNYADVTTEQVLTAAEKLLRWVDEADFKFSHNDEDIHAQRRWMQYAIIVANIGTDFWHVKATPIDGGVRVMVQSSVQSQSITPTPTTGVEWTAGTSPLQGEMINSPAMYALFFSRLDFLLGRTSTWTTCDKMHTRRESGLVRGSLRAMCDELTTANYDPPSWQESDDEPPSDIFMTPN